LKNSIEKIKTNTGSNIDIMVAYEALAISKVLLREKEIRINNPAVIKIKINAETSRIRMIFPAAAAITKITNKEKATR